MKLQFLLCENPNKPDQGTYVYHAQKPRFLARVHEKTGATIITDNIDNASDDVLLSKIKRAQDWYISTLNKSHAHP